MTTFLLFILTFCVLDISRDKMSAVDHASLLIALAGVGVVGVVRTIRTWRKQ